MVTALEGGEGGELDAEDQGGAVEIALEREWSEGCFVFTSKLIGAFVKKKKKTSISAMHLKLLLLPLVSEQLPSAATLTEPRYSQ